MADEPNQAADFAAELRRRRLEASLSLRELAGRMFFSKSQLSKVENGQKPPSESFARQADAALSAGGELSRLAISQVRADRDHIDPLASWARSQPPVPITVGPRVLESFRRTFDELRGLGQETPPGVLVPILREHTSSLKLMASNVDSSTRVGLLGLAARFAEYTGWMAQEADDDHAALWWTDHAADLARQAGDDDFAVYALVRRGLLALYRHDSVETIALARHAQQSRCHPRIRGLAAQREAQGHALAGDYSSCQRALERARVLMSAAASQVVTGPVIGTSHLADPVAFADGWCLQDLGYPVEAARVLDAELALVPAHAQRSRARLRARLAFALASCGELDQACDIGAATVESMSAIDSATIRSDLRHLARVLNRWHSYAPVRELMPRLSMVLHRPGFPVATLPGNG